MGSQTSDTDEVSGQCQQRNRRRIDINPEGVYVDALLVEEGVSYVTKKYLQEEVCTFDQDKDAHANKINDKRLNLIHTAKF